MTNLTKTSAQYDSIIEKCIDIFSKKMVDYGAVWRLYHPTTLTDLIFIKALRIYTIVNSLDGRRVDEGVDGELIAVVNYSIMYLIQKKLGVANINDSQTSHETCIQLFNQHIQQIKSLMMNKNHDYGEAWKGMRLNSILEIIFIKVLRIKQIEDNEGKTIISEGEESNYYDIINYSIFALLKLSENDK